MISPLIAVPRAAAEDIESFSSDGCSLFPDGTFDQASRWCQCCFEHDIAYWQGGSSSRRLAADKALRDCVLVVTSDETLATAMYLGVRAGGHPAFPTWYRWGYGWTFGRGYKNLDDSEKEQVQRRLHDYRTKKPRGFCGDGSEDSRPR